MQHFKFKQVLKMIRFKATKLDYDGNKRINNLTHLEGSILEIDLIDFLEFDA